jgi:ribosomal protein L11
VTLTFDVPPNARNTRPSVRVTIETDRSFTPTPGEPPKSILVRRIALEPRL